MTIDPTDRRLLAALQRDGQATAETLGAALHLSPSQAGRRRQRLEADGTIIGYRAVIDPARAGLGVEALIQVVMAAHTDGNARDFQRLVRTLPDVVAAWTLTGEADYLLRVFCTDLPALNLLIQTVLLPHAAVARVHSQIVLDRVKPDAGLPV